MTINNHQLGEWLGLLSLNFSSFVEHCPCVSYFASFSSKVINPIALWRFLCTIEAFSFPFVRDDGMEVFMQVISDRR